jgi:hypothetical protein
MAVKKNIGKVIAQVEGLRIRQITNSSKSAGKKMISTTDIGIYKGKNLVENGFKSKEFAVNRANEIKSKIVR